MPLDRHARNVSANLRAALAYAEELGWPVFPLKPGGKTPLTPHGLNDASTSAEQITAWWSEHPTANVAVVTGAPSGIVVIDVDGPQGDEALAALGTLPACPTSSTGKGRHLFFQRPADGLRNSAGKLGPQLDVRGDGGYIVVAPSTHPSGAKYKWLTGLHPLHVALPALPNAVVARLSDPLSSVGSGDAHARTAAEIPLLERIPEGQRNQALAEYAGRLLAKGHGELETLAIVRGLNISQCVPPLPPDEVENVVRSIAMAEQRQKLQRNGDAPNADVSQPTARRGPVALSEYLTQPELLTPPTAFVPRLAFKGRSTLFAGLFKAGKTTLVCQACAAASCAGGFLGDQLTDPQVVLWYAIDESLGDTVRRFKELGADPLRVYIVDEPPTAVEMRADVEATGATVVVVDTMISLWGDSFDENNASDMAPRLRPFIAIPRELGVALLFLHHTNRAGSDYRGSGHLGAVVDVIVTMQAVGVGVPDAAGDPTVEDVRRILKGKGRGGIHFHERLTFDGARYVLGNAAPVHTLRSRILTLLLDEPASGNKIAKDLKARREAVLDEIRALTVDVLVRRAEGGQQYELTDAGKMSALNAQDVADGGSEGGSRSEDQEPPGNHLRVTPVELVHPSGTIAEPVGNHPGTTTRTALVPEKNPRGLEREPPNESSEPNRLAIAL